MATSTSKVAKFLNGKFYNTSVTSNNDGSLKSTTFRTNSSGGAGIPISSIITDTNGRSTPRTFESGATTAERIALLNPSSPETKSVNNQIGDAKPYGTNPSDEQKKQINAAAGKPNQATKSPTTGNGATGAAPPAKPEDKSAFNDENSEYKSGTREKYDDNLVYPLNLKSELQDVIKFRILKYSPSLAKGNQSAGGFGSSKSRVVTLQDGSPIVTGSTPIGSIILPIPAGISDGNTVGWQDDSMNMLQSEGAKLANSFFDNGIDGASKSIGNTADALGGAAKTGELQTSVKAAFTSIATQSPGVAGRAFGVQFNNNLELLFNNPSLRSFSFTFSFYPRSAPESIRVKKIIRAFKQSMSVKRSKSALLLKAPHTFAISYVTAGGKLHPYLNRFKECALTSCSVDYTPDGTYMTYGGEEKSMTAYRLSLSFQELEPIFDDEYGQNDDNIGF